MLRCPKCKRSFTDKRYCPEHGLPLVELDSLSPGPGSDRIGMVIGGKYRVITRIGEGGMGQVFKVEHVAMGRLMALKVLHRELSAHEQAVLRFEREARAASQLGHPHIIMVSDFGFAPDGSLYIAMEYLEGKDLFDELRDVRIMDAQRTVHIMRQVCSGLDAAHRSGVIHRDLKPENIFLAQGREFPDFVKVLDFGIAKILETGPEERTLTASGTIFGTPEYLSPEQAAGSEIDHRADIYSLGIIMYRMAAGRLPFVGNNKSILIQRQLNEMPLPFCERPMPQEVPDDLERIIFKLLAKDPDDRYQTVEQLKEALERVDTRSEELRAEDAAQQEPIKWIVFHEDDRPEGMPPRCPTIEPRSGTSESAQERIPGGDSSRRSWIPLVLALALVLGLAAYWLVLYLGSSR